MSEDDIKASNLIARFCAPTDKSNADVPVLFEWIEPKPEGGPYDVALRYWKYDPEAKEVDAKSVTEVKMTERVYTKAEAEPRYDNPANIPKPKEDGKEEKETDEKKAEREAAEKKAEEDRKAGMRTVVTPSTGRRRLICSLLSLLWC
mgnify:CR=1 FL=1